MALTDAATYLAFSQNTAPTAALSAFLAQVIPQIDLAIRNDLHSVVIEQQAGIVEYIDGNGREDLYLKFCPVQSVTEIRDSNTGYAGQGTGFDSTSILVAAQDYYVPTEPHIINGTVYQWSMSGCVRRINGRWWNRFGRPPDMLANSQVRGSSNFMVTYTAGWTPSPATVPLDLTLAANMVISFVRTMATKGRPLQTESFRDYSYAYGDWIQAAMQTGSVASILARYRRIQV